MINLFFFYYFNLGGEEGRLSWRVDVEGEVIESLRWMVWRLEFQLPSLLMNVVGCFIFRLSISY
jgi:hypothetical protein